MSVAFKEWALICEALGTGRQSIILRKGGIAEGRAGFRFQHPEFLLFPTWFHEQLSRTRLPADTPVPEPSESQLDVRFAASVEWTRVVKERALLDALREHHFWSDEVVQERFAYSETPGLHVAFVRIFRLDPPHCLAMEKKYGGCRSWVDLPDPDGAAWVSVVSDEEHEDRKSRILALLRRCEP